jgi:signal transduction histidine kinase
MDQPAASVNLKKAQEREKHLRFEKVAERSTYLVVLGAFLLTFLPLPFAIERTSLYILLLLALLVSFAWFRLLSPNFIGPLKSFLYFFLSIGFVYLGVHFTGGIQSFAIFIFYLSVLRAAAYIEIYGFWFIVFSICGLLLVEASLFNTDIALNERLSLWGLHVWALLLMALFGRYIFDQEKFVEESEESLKLKAAKQIDSVKNEFVFVISKKLKDPLQVLENYLSTALKSTDEGWTQDLRDFLTKAWENAQRLTNLVKDLSDLSSIESQKLNLELQPVSLNQVIGSTLSDFSMRAAEKSIALNYQPLQTEVEVLADPSRLHEILANLVDNAIKYSQKSTAVQISFSHDDKFAQVVIKDSGVGIPESAKPHLFEKFYRVSRAASEPKGTGLGLFVSKELVERQGGRIWFESQENQGTSFHFTVPLATNNKNDK